LFCVPKAAVLHGKSGTIVTQNRHYCKAKVLLSFFTCIFLYKQKSCFTVFIPLLCSCIWVFKAYAR